MAKGTVQAVRQAELNAAQSEKETAARREKILSGAQQNAKILLTSMTKEAADQSEKDFNAAKQKASEIMEEAVSRAEKEVLIIREMVKEKEKSAIDLVLNNVI